MHINSSSQVSPVHLFAGSFWKNRLKYKSYPSLKVQQAKYDLPAVFQDFKITNYCSKSLNMFVCMTIYDSAK